LAYQHAAGGANKGMRFRHRWQNEICTVDGADGGTGMVAVLPALSSSMDKGSSTQQWILGPIGTANSEGPVTGSGDEGICQTMVIR